MLKEMIYNSRYINELFTSKDFEFINEFDSEIAKLDNHIHIEEQKRDTIVNFINSLNDKIKSVPNDKILSVQAILNNVNDIFDLVNTNIKSLCSIEKDIETLNSSIVDLLITAEKNSNSDELNAETISNIKQALSDCSTNLEETKKTIFLNDIKIDKFIKDSLSNINIKITVNQSNSTDISKSVLDVLSDTSTDTTPQTDHKPVYDSDIKDNDTLIISETSKKVYLPYSASEVTKIYNSYSDSFSSYRDVINKEFILPLESFSKHPSIARFRESYSLVRQREMKPLIDSLKYSFDLMFNYNLNPAVIAACKSKKELDYYLEALKKNDLDSFKFFKIKYELHPTKHKT